MKNTNDESMFSLAGPFRVVTALAKQLGLSNQMFRQLFKHLLSPRRMNRVFSGFEPSSRDVVVATYVRSGTNWMMQIALQIAHRGAADFEHIHDRVPWPDTPGPGPIDLDDPRGWESAPTGLRVIKTHAAADEVPKSADAKYVVVLRDPKEVLVSAYYFAGALLGLLDHVTPAQWVETNMKMVEGEGSWLRHAMSWWSLRHEPNVLVLTFGDLKRDPEGSIAQVAELMGVDLTEDEMAAVLERSSLSYMKAHKAEFEPIGVSIVTADRQPEMIRRGVSGGSDEMLSREQQAEVDRRIMAALERVGSDFPYRELFEVKS